MHKIYTFKDNHKLNFIAALTSITGLLLGSNLFYQPVHATTPGKAGIVPSKGHEHRYEHRDEHRTHHKAEPLEAATHPASTIAATLGVYTKTSDIENNLLLKNIQQSTAFSADSPSNNPDATTKAAVIRNLNINETLEASLFRQNKFDISQLIDIAKEHFVLGNLTHGNVMHIVKGNGLFIPTKDIVVVLSDLADIHIGAGSLVGVLHPTPDIVAIYDLEDGGSKKVSVKISNETFALAPGKSLIISKEDHEFEEINPAQRIPYRNLESKKLQSGLHTYKTEFSISAAIIHVKPLQKILLSNDPEDCKIANRLLKNQVILEDVFSASEPYTMPADVFSASEPNKMPTGAVVKVSNKSTQS